MDKTVRLWDATTGNAIGEPLPMSETWVNRVCFSPDGLALASMSEDGTIRFWDASTKMPIGTPMCEDMDSGSDLCFSPDSQTLASTAGDGKVRLWDVSTCQALGEARHVPDVVVGVAFGDKGRRLMSLGRGGVGSVWTVIPWDERIGVIRAIREKADAVRATLADQIARTGDSVEDVSELQSAVLADPRLSGDFRRAALLVVGEVSLDRQTRRDERDRRTSRVLSALRDTKWPDAIAAAAQLEEGDFSEFDAAVLNELAWEGLIADPTDSPARDLSVLLRLAERAADLSRRADGAILDTLARAHWELGDKPMALAVQAEAIKTLEAQVAGAVDAQRREALAKLLPELRDTLARYERDEPPAPVTPK
jgi:hypothetical protein